MEPIMTISYDPSQDPGDPCVFLLVEMTDDGVRKIHTVLESWISDEPELWAAAEGYLDG